VRFRIQVSIDELALAYLADACPQVSVTAERRHLRSSAHGADLVVPRCRTTRYGQRSFVVSGSAQWNSLSQPVRVPSLSLTQFCSNLKTFFYFTDIAEYHHSASVTVSIVRSCAYIKTLLDGTSLPWVREPTYLGVFLVSSRKFKCSLDYATRAFYRAANAIFGKVAKAASEEVVLHRV
jgi:hypothetical protein